MKKEWIKLAALVVATAIFSGGYSYYASKEIKTRDAVVMMEYSVLDNQVWSMEGEAKERALAADNSYDAIEAMKAQHRSASRKKIMGKVLAILFGAITAGYLARLLFQLGREAVARRREELRSEH